MFRSAVWVLLFTMFSGTLLAQGTKNEPFRQPKGPETEISQAELQPNSPPPPASRNWALSQVDGRVIAVFSLLWVAAIVIAMGALLRAEATDEYHGAGPDPLGR